MVIKSIDLNTLEDKVEQVLEQLKWGKVRVVFDLTIETALTSHRWTFYIQTPAFDPAENNL